MRSRFLAPLLALLVLLAPAFAAEPQGRRFVVAFAQDDLSNDWRAAQVRDLERAFAAHPDVQFIYSDARGQSARQIWDIENFAARGVDLIITSPRDAVAMTPVVEAVHRKGIPVVLLSRRVESDAFDVFIGASNARIAERAADRLAHRLNGKGRILVLQHVPTTSVAKARTDGFLERLGRYPGLTIAAIEPADSLRGKAIQVVEKALSQGLAFDAIYAQSDSMAAGARLALQNAGIDPARIPIVGIDYIAEAREAIRNGTQDASFTYPTFGAEGAQAALDLLRGKAVPREIWVESTMVTRDNVEAVAPIF